MGKRRNTRLKVALPVRVVGVEPGNRTVKQMACTLDVSARGARLNGLHQPLETGSIVAVERGRCRVLFRVMWVGSREERTQGQVGLLALDPESNPWEGVTFLEEPDEHYVPMADIRSSIAFAKRSNHYSCDGEVQISSGDGRQYSGKLRDLGTGGCYVCTDRPLGLRTQVHLQLCAAARAIAAKGIVTSSDRCQGMWVEFTSISAEDLRVFCETVEALDESTRHSYATR